MAVMVTWTGNGDGTSFNDPHNWSPVGVPGDVAVSIPSGAQITLTANATLASFTVTNGGSVGFSGHYTLTLNANPAVTLAAGETISLGTGTTLNVNTGLSFSGNGVFTIAGGSFVTSGTIKLNNGQNLVLSGTSFTSSSPASGDGTITLEGSTANFTGAGPTVAIDFTAVPAGGADNVLYLSNNASGLDLQNIGYGDKVYVGGLNLGIIEKNGVYELVVPAWGNSVLGVVTLAPGTSANDFQMSGGYLVYTGDAPCFYAGTMIATPAGAMAVEEIRAGDEVLTADSRALRVRWVGQSHVSTRFANKLRCLPIRIKAGALAEGVPARDLLVSPDHALFLRGVLVQAGALVNGTSILREADVPEVFTYYHVELASHELLLAENTPAESFVDNLDRMSFSNWDRREAPRQAIQEMACPRAKSARQLPAALRREIEDRAGLFALSEAA